MDEITEREIAEAAKAWFGSRRFHWTWETAPVQMRWAYLSRAYAALRAARKARG
jgi:hypothetical protein